MATDPLEALKAFENEADRRMDGLSLWRLPFRSVYSAALLAAEAAFGGPQFRRERRQAEPERGAAMLARYTYWRPYWRQCAPAIGRDLDDALSVIGAPEAGEIGQALVYAHFCELMPFVYRGAFSVEATATGFRLSYPSEAASRCEAMDVVVSELALTTFTERFRYDLRPLVRMVDGWPRVDARDLQAVLRSAFDFHLGNVREHAFIGAEAYEGVLGFTHGEFMRVRAAMMALGSWCLGMSTAAEALSLDEQGERQLHFQKECLEWRVPLLDAGMIYAAIEALSQVAADRVDSILAYFSEHPLAAGGVSGEGYLAPLQRIGDALLVSPTAMLTMTPERNILYVLNRKDRNRFNDLVSGELEPSLLAHAAGLFRRIKGIDVETNVAWNGREIDLVAYCRATNTALQMQAKAAIPASGARMTRQVEENCLTAVRQLEWFEALPSTDRDGLIRARFGHAVEDVRWASGVLSRSSFGTVQAWQAMDGRGAVNLVLLTEAVRRLATLPTVDLTKFPGLAWAVMTEVVDEVVQGWDEDALDVFGRRVAFPLLRLDHEALVRRQLALVDGN